jgi:hypothetical protein
MYIRGLILLLFYFLFFLLNTISCVFLQSNVISSQPPLTYVPTYLSTSTSPSLQD